MRYLWTTLMLVGLVTLWGCGTVIVSQDYDPDTDFPGHATWQWRDPVQALSGHFRIDNPLLDKRIRRAIEAHLTHQNIRMIEEQPEMLVAYHLEIEHKIQTDTYYSTIGVGGYYHPWYGGMGGETRIRQYEESRLTIDMLSIDTGELLWRGVGIFRPRTYDTPIQAAEAMQVIVDQILDQFPPALPE